MEIVQYYDECWVERFGHGHNARSLAIHFGLYDGLNDELEAPSDIAKARLNDVLIDALESRSDAPRRLLDLGCGVGGTALHLARERPAWSIVGANISRRQVGYARGAAERRQLGERVHFEVSDYHSLRDVGSDYDAAYAIESLCHAAERSAVLTSVHRVLRPGAPLVVIDFFRTRFPIRSAEAARHYADVKAGFCIHDYYDDCLEELLAGRGFAAVETVDLTSRVLPGVRRSAVRAERALSNGGHSVRWRAHYGTCVALAPLLEAGLLEYRLVSAIRDS